jgi:flagellar biosynthesis/type III secretory pathway protein FliH
VGRIVKGFGRVVPKATLDARAEAAALLATARAEAEQIRADADAVRAEAMDQGLEAGRAAGLAEMAAWIAAARADEERRLETARPLALPLAIKMAERIIGRAVAVAPELMVDIVGEALAACRSRAGAVTVRVHSDDLPAVEARQGELAAKAPGASAIALVADDNVGRHGCVIETAQGRVDARLESQLAALERALTGGGLG